MCVVLDGEKQPELFSRLGAASVYPTIQFMTANETQLGRVEGSPAPEELLAAMQRATTAMARRPLPVRLFR